MYFDDCYDQISGSLCNQLASVYFCAFPRKNRMPPGRAKYHPDMERALLADARAAFCKRPKNFQIYDTEEIETPFNSVTKSQGKALPKFLESTCFQRKSDPGALSRLNKNVKDYLGEIAEKQVRERAKTSGHRYLKKQNLIFTSDNMWSDEMAVADATPRKYNLKQRDKNKPPKQSETPHDHSLDVSTADIQKEPTNQAKVKSPRATDATDKIKSPAADCGALEKSSATGANKKAKSPPSNAGANKKTKSPPSAAGIIEKQKSPPADSGEIEKKKSPPSAAEVIAKTKSSAAKGATKKANPLAKPARAVENVETPPVTTGAIKKTKSSSAATASIGKKKSSSTATNADEKTKSSPTATDSVQKTKSSPTTTGTIPKAKSPQDFTGAIEIKKTPRGASAVYEKIKTPGIANGVIVKTKTKKNKKNGKKKSKAMKNVSKLVYLPDFFEDAVALGKSSDEPTGAANTDNGPSDVSPCKNQLLMPEDVLTPGIDILIKIRIYKPFDYTELQNTPGKNSCHLLYHDLVLTGRHKVYDIKEAFICTEKNPDFKGNSKNGFLFIKNAFYVDNEGEATAQADWLRETCSSRQFGEFPRHDMRSVRMDELDFKLGNPDVYIHDETCEHIIIFTQVRLVTAHDPVLLMQYPLVTPLRHNQKTPFCYNCAGLNPQWIVSGCLRIPFNKALFCDDCLKKLMFGNNGRKCCNFKAYPYDGTEEVELPNL